MGVGGGDGEGVGREEGGAVLGCFLCLICFSALMNLVLVRSQKSKSYLRVWITLF